MKKIAESSTEIIGKHIVNTSKDDFFSIVKGCEDFIADIPV